MSIRSREKPVARSVTETVADFNAATSADSARLATGQRIRLSVPFTAGARAFIQEIFFGSGWKHGVSGLVAAGLAAMERSVLFIKVYFEQHNNRA